MVSFAAYQLNFIVIGYKQDLFKLENYQFTKCFINLGVGVCVCACVCMCVCVCVCKCVSVFLEKRSNWNYLSLPIFTFPIRRRRKDVTSVPLCNSVNSAPLCSLEIIMKMLITIATILTANLICKKQFCSLSKIYKFQKRSTKKFAFCKTILDVKKTKF